MQRMKGCDRHRCRNAHFESRVVDASQAAVAGDALATSLRTMVALPSIPVESPTARAALPTCMYSCRLCLASRAQISCDAIGTKRIARSTVAMILLPVGSHATLARCHRRDVNRTQCCSDAIVAKRIARGSVAILSSPVESHATFLRNAIVAMRFACNTASMALAAGGSRATKLRCHRRHAKLMGHHSTQTSPGDSRAPQLRCHRSHTVNGFGMATPVQVRAQ